MTAVVEWWPDHGSVLLHLRSGPGGTPVELASLALSDSLVARLTTWNAAYEEDKLPIDGPGDPEWLDTGVRLLAELRGALAGRYSVVVTEPWWGEPPSD